jgi:hypothetical protein
MSLTGITKLLAMMRKKNYEFRSKFYNFWSSREFTMNFYSFYKVMNEFLIELDKFYQTHKLESKFELGFHKKRQHLQFLKFNPNFTKFEPNLDLIWIKPKEK